MDQKTVFKHIGKIAGMIGMAIAEHGIILNMNKPIITEFCKTFERFRECMGEFRVYPVSVLIRNGTAIVNVDSSLYPISL